jgi:hypothetical protein
VSLSVRGAFLLAIGGVVGTIILYLLQSGPGPLVVTSKTDLAPYHLITQNDLELRPASNRRARSGFADSGKVAGRYTLGAVKGLEPLTEAQLGPLVDPQSFANRSVALLVVSKSVVQGAGLRPGATIDLVFVQPATDARAASAGSPFDVLVLDLKDSGDGGAGDSKAPDPSLVVLAVASSRQQEFARDSVGTPIFVRRTS